MALTPEELHLYKQWCNGLKNDINSNKPYAKKTYLKELDNIIKKEENLNCSNTDNNFGPNYRYNYYGSNNVYIMGCNNSRSGGKVCSLF